MSLRRKLYRLHAPHLRFIFRALLFILLIVQRIQDTHRLRPWLLPDRRQSPRRTIDQFKPAFALVFATIPTLAAFTLSASNPRPILVFFAYFGGLLSIIILLTLTRLVIARIKVKTDY